MAQSTPSSPTYLRCFLLFIYIVLSPFGIFHITYTGDSHEILSQDLLGIFSLYIYLPDNQPSIDIISIDSETEAVR